ncbi:MAG: hypothetical protein GXP27_05895, partial [Planctomycetes bacterium]|nr:hypothetical protein [Planctomycetota bacterium]
MGKRWYHWTGVDPAVTHLETGLAVDAHRFAGRGQRIDLTTDAPIMAVQVKVKRIGRPGALLWEVGTRWGQRDLGSGRVAAEKVCADYEHFVTLPIKPCRPKRLFVRLRAESGRCPDDYYAVYCRWSEVPRDRMVIHTYTGTEEVGMMYRIVRPDEHGVALEPPGRLVGQGASLLTRLLSAQPGPNRRQLFPWEEEPFDFVEDLVAGIDPKSVGLPNSNAHPVKEEIVLADGWTIRVAAPRSPQVETAVDDLQCFLRERMNVEVEVQWKAALPPALHSIMLTQGPDQPDGPR